MMETRYEDQEEEATEDQREDKFAVDNIDTDDNNEEDKERKRQGMWGFHHDYDHDDGLDWNDNESFRSQMEKGLKTVSVALVNFLDNVIYGLVYPPL